MQVSETEGQAELYWVIEQSVLEKISSIYFHRKSLAFSRMFFSESKCSWYRGFISNLITWNLYLYLCFVFVSNLYFIFESPQKKKRHSVFLKEILIHKCLFKFPLWRELITSLLIFLICSKNLKAASLSFHWFNNSRIRGFKLVTRGFELVTRGFELLTRRFELVTPGFELVTREFEL